MRWAKEKRQNTRQNSGAGEINQLHINTEQEETQMADRRDYKTLIEAVERYVNSKEFPELETVLAILGIERKADHGTDTEL